MHLKGELEPLGLDELRSGFSKTGMADAIDDEFFFNSQTIASSFLYYQSRINSAFSANYMDDINFKKKLYDEPTILHAI